MMKAAITTRRRYAMGAEVQAGAVHFRVWAPRRHSVDVMFEDGRAAAPLAAEAEGYFAGAVEGAGAGTRYRFRLDGGDAFPDPASRFQPEGPHGASEVVDPTFDWTDGAWSGVPREGQVLYEMHVGTFTREGTFAAARRELPRLVDLGVTVVELMPVADFPGRFGWGYDGVNLFAPTRLYGRPEEFRRFVDAAHAAGMGVILDVVYNHFGPDGNFLPQYSDTWHSRAHEGEWGEPLNFDGAGSAGVREFVAGNAAYWIEEFHLDGLRLDATQALHDDSDEHVMALVSRRARAAAGRRRILLVAENESQHTRLVRPHERGGYGLDALWNDDFHHSARVALTGKREAYYRDYRGRPQEFVSAVKHGFLYQGQHYRWQKQRRGTPALGLPAEAFVAYLENHDQVANSVHGRRLHQLANPGRLRAVTALLLLGPATPMLFQGQEFASPAPFLYFADHAAELSAKVRAGRGEFMSQFQGAASTAVQDQLADPADPAVFERCRLAHSDRERYPEAWALHRDLLHLRKRDDVVSGRRRTAIDGAVLAEDAFVIRMLGTDGDDRLLLVNLGPEQVLDVVPEPLLAPPAERSWQVLWSSDDPRYGGGGAWEPETATGWRLPGEAAVLLHPVARTTAPSPTEDGA
jgi:maltooligosyltrehalose trehalohydrolase